MEPIATHFILLVTGFVQIYYYFLDGEKRYGYCFIECGRLYFCLTCQVRKSVERNEPQVFLPNL